MLRRVAFLSALAVTAMAQTAGPRRGRTISRRSVPPTGITISRRTCWSGPDSAEPPKKSRRSPK